MLESNEFEPIEIDELHPLARALSTQNELELLKFKPQTSELDQAARIIKERLSGWQEYVLIGPEPLGLIISNKNDSLSLASHTRYWQLTRLNASPLAAYYLAQAEQGQDNFIQAEQIILDSAKKLWPSLSTLAIWRTLQEKYGTIGDVLHDEPGSPLAKRLENFSLALLAGKDYQTAAERALLLLQERFEPTRITSIVSLLKREFYRHQPSAEIISYLIEEFSYLMHGAGYLMGSAMITDDIKPSLVLGIKSAPSQEKISAVKAALLLAFIAKNERTKCIRELGVSREALGRLENLTLNDILEAALPGLAGTKLLDDLEIAMYPPVDYSEELICAFNAIVNRLGDQSVNRPRVHFADWPITEDKIEELRQSIPEARQRIFRLYSQKHPLALEGRIGKLMTPINSYDVNPPDNLESKKREVLSLDGQATVKQTEKILEKLMGLTYTGFINVHDGELSENVRMGRLLKLLPAEKYSIVQSPICFTKTAGRKNEKVVGAWVSLIGEPFGVVIVDGKKVTDSNALIKILGLPKAVATALKEGD